MLKKVYRALGILAWAIIVLSIVWCSCECYYYRVLPDSYDGVPVSGNLGLGVSVMETIVLVGSLLALMGVFKALDNAANEIDSERKRRKGTGGFADNGW